MHSPSYRFAKDFSLAVMNGFWCSRSATIRSGLSQLCSIETKPWRLSRIPIPGSEVCLLAWNFSLAHAGLWYYVHSTRLTHARNVIRKLCAIIYFYRRWIPFLSYRYMQVVHRRAHRIYFTHTTVGTAILLAWVIPLTIFLVVPLVSDWSCRKTCKWELKLFVAVAVLFSNFCFKLAVLAKPGSI